VALASTDDAEVGGRQVLLVLHDLEGAVVVQVSAGDELESIL
jgi:hypothetical protein